MTHMHTIILWEFGESSREQINFHHHYSFNQLEIHQIFEITLLYGSVRALTWLKFHTKQKCEQPLTKILKYCCCFIIILLLIYKKKAKVIKQHRSNMCMLNRSNLQKLFACQTFAFLINHHIQSIQPYSIYSILFIFPIVDSIKRSMNHHTPACIYVYMHLRIGQSCQYCPVYVGLVYRFIFHRLQVFSVVSAVNSHDTCRLNKRYESSKSPSTHQLSSLCWQLRWIYES